jgi:hypothetical protein
MLSQQLHPPPCTSFVPSRPRCTDSCTAIRPFSVVLMANLDAFGQWLVTVEAPKGIGWLGRWFGGGAEAAGHGFDG